MYGFASLHSLLSQKEGSYLPASTGICEIDFSHELHLIQCRTFSVVLCSVPSAGKTAAECHSDGATHSGIPRTLSCFS